MLLVGFLLAGCLLSERPPALASGDLLTLPIAGDYEMASRKRGCPSPRGCPRLRIEATTPGSYRLIFVKPETAHAPAQGTAYSFRILPGRGDNEYLVFGQVENAPAEAGAFYFLMQRQAAGIWSIHVIGRHWERSNALWELPIRGDSQSTRLTGEVSAKSLADLLHSPAFEKEFAVDRVVFEMRLLPANPL